MSDRSPALPVLDHLVVATDSLERGSAYLAERFGVEPDAGGRHENAGTHNRLLALGGGTYLELIAPDPEQPEPARPRSFGLDDSELRARVAVRPRLVQFMVRTTHIETACELLDYSPGTPRTMRRGDLEWRIALDGYPAGALANPLPGMLEWGDNPSPGYTLPPRGVVLSRLHVLAGDDDVRRLTPLAGDRRIHLRAQRTPMLIAEFMTPRGWVILD